MERSLRVLSIQSHVVHGYVGNRAAVFPLQILGFEVDFINSVQFSNHTGYKHVNGPVLSCNDIETLYQTLKKNDVIFYDYVLTGYCYDKDMLKKIVEIIKELKLRNPKLIYVCDPVMGDIYENGPNMYVPENILPVFQKHVVEIVDILTPNQYEAQLLTGTNIDCEKDILKCLDLLHDMGPSTVIMSSTCIGDPGMMNAYISEQAGNTCTQGKLCIPKIGKDFVGSGDLFAALLLAWTSKHPDDKPLAFQKVVSTMQHVLKRTQKYAEGLAGIGKSPTLPQLELRLIQSKKDIENPQICVQYYEIA